MTDTATGGAHYAHRMLGIPRTPSGMPMPEARWYQLTPPLPVRDTIAPFVVVTKDGVYECDSRANVDFTRCVHQWPIGVPPADVLAGVGDGYVGL